MILTHRRSGTDSIADSRKVILALSGRFSPESLPGGRGDHVMHEETFIGSSPGIIKFDVGQLLGDSVDLSSGVLRVACMMLM